MIFMREFQELLGKKALSLQIETIYSACQLLICSNSAVVHETLFFQLVKHRNKT